MLIVLVVLWEIVYGDLAVEFGCDDITVLFVEFDLIYLQQLPSKVIVEMDDMKPIVFITA